MAKFSSPREEALEIAYNTRRKILDDTLDPISILRACSVIANNLNKNDAKKWIMQELSGYQESEKIPSYRKISCRYEVMTVPQDDFYTFDVLKGAHLL